ncbi:FitA-like ribbon-helix-helix domain-containing protein [Serratia fonticola]|uniref:Antitoxin FitA-like ribbon-helix-helix domain-containing protein n=1 Tax=Serratia fonticola TaxID=47917 RepID=A0AAW3WW92_SERFO|nr:hypothetical protein [Serratia fonticola]MBC3214766.1 hypothetical protein [Serratia fonticola]NYA15841.1 hypothetical protein [Serratia fonticola]NYA35687.1 hypothetical protein [Serratia fonticola]
MAKIQARNVDDALYQRIEASAMRHERSLEGEIRIALREYYAPKEVDEAAQRSLREQWQQQTGHRLQWLFDRLIADGYLDKWKRERPAGIADFVRVSRQLHASPGQLMDLIEGRREMTHGMADELAKQFSANSDWLLTGEASPFSVTRLGSSGYSAFFLPADKGAYTFELLRIKQGRHEGTLIILRTRTDTGQTAFGIVTEAFYLRSGMGGGGHAELKAFILFLKTKCGHLAMNTFDFTPPEPDFDFWSVIGHHHPVWFQDADLRSTARWLHQVFNGDDPGDWFAGWSSDLNDIAGTPFGGSAEHDVE